MYRNSVDNRKNNYRLFHIIANNSLKYDEEIMRSHLNRAYRGAILAVQEETE